MQCSEEQLKTAENDPLHAIAAFIAATFSFEFNAPEGLYKGRIEYIWKLYAEVKNWISSISIIFSEYQRGDKWPYFSIMWNFVPAKYRN
jgi:hypothetical protein